MSFIFNLSKNSAPVEPILRSMKMTDISLYLGNTVVENQKLQYAKDRNRNWVQFYGLQNVFENSVKELQLANFINKAYNSYGMIKVGCIMGDQKGFQKALNYNQSSAALSQPNGDFNDFNFENEFWFGERVQFTVPLIVTVGLFYRIVLNSVVYGYMCAVGDTSSDVANAIYALLPAVTWTKSQPSARVIQVWANSVYSPYTYGAINLNSSVINLSKAEWLNTLSFIKSELLISGRQWYTSAYVQNYEFDPRWDQTDAADMLHNLDYYESTNYVTAPDAGRSIKSQLKYFANALAADPSVKPQQKFLPIQSAETIYMGPYYGTNGVVVAETAWKTDYTANLGLSVYANHNYVKYVGGTNIFDDTLLQVYIP